MCWHRFRMAGTRGKWRGLVNVDPVGRGFAFQWTSRRVRKGPLGHSMSTNRCRKPAHRPGKHQNIGNRECPLLPHRKLAAALNDLVPAVADHSRAQQHPCAPPRDPRCASPERQALAAQQMLPLRLSSLRLQSCRIQWQIWRPTLCICN